VTPEEATLLTKFREGDRAAFDRLAEVCRERAVRLCRTFLRDGDEAQDAVQEALQRGWARREEFRGDAAFFTWLSSIAVNICRNRLRARNAQLAQNTVSMDAPENVRLQEVPDPQPSVEEQVLGPLEPVLERVMEQAQGRWDRLDYDLFTLHYGQGKTFDEAARILGVPSSTLRSRKRDHLQPVFDAVAKEFAK
jgi:RNA polymerase sigma-70 factor, ECF subfamily